MESGAISATLAVEIEATCSCEKCGDQLKMDSLNFRESDIQRNSCK